MIRRVVVLYRGALAHYSFEKLDNQTYQLTFITYTGEQDGSLPEQINLFRNPNNSWSGDAGSQELLEELVYGIMSGGNY